MAVLNEEQTMLKDMVSQWVRDRMPVSVARGLYDHSGGGRKDATTGFDRDAYGEVAAMGWSGILVPEAHGGSDFGAFSLGFVLEELARTLSPLPLLSSAMIAVSALRLGGNAAQQSAWLPGLADGSIIGTLAVDEGAHHAPDTLALTATRVANGWRLDGIKRPVADGMGADLFIVAARGEDATMLFLVPADTAGLTREPLDQIDARRPALLRFDGVLLGDDAVLGHGDALLSAILDRAYVGQAAELLGLATQAFETTLDYLKTRVQFGQLIGSFQALQHRASEMFGELQLTRSAVEAALAAIDADDPQLPSLASLAKAMANGTAHRITCEMVQLHGGIGMTHEHDAGLYLKRSRVAEQAYGSSSFHRERWARLNGY
ncbi:MAG: acyl-CoA dehydrogenase [Novosphingobium sp. 63-713]|uniref:acyl-CoA dehydrogenase family protein n=1 Tax=unclassified Novosphingobium TaxID=2644732 RepID=UPI00086B2F95|nr:MULTISPECIES: acyl-CoA dehydrogenase family protein [unclassified Novosphingobium]MBN9145137.1 acyl-CoA dehydrogenase family protein [Novosphingobium sp.]MDR6709058.1 alkylation response protein AidB-like acyl-CoA dehydrogenase [Novosphingobium sp. 1748]ODU70916.1 MAG: acyl-CoA dehydrogenase [Novosphingobium sp. SCN 66-18]OJX89868.1 MAG: acyl-CoA dehydrogenase [Novosphingobium sp. 63-713]